MSVAGALGDALADGRSKRPARRRRHGPGSRGRALGARTRPAVPQNVETRVVGRAWVEAEGSVPERPRDSEAVPLERASHQRSRWAGQRAPFPTPRSVSARSKSTSCERTARTRRCRTGGRPRTQVEALRQAGAVATRRSSTASCYACCGAPRVKQRRDATNRVSRDRVRSAGETVPCRNAHQGGEHGRDDLSRVTFMCECEDVRCGDGDRAP